MTRRLFWLTAIALTAPAWSAPARINLALHKKVKLHPRPNYRLCTDPQDRVQLTDGVYTQGYFWTRKSTVGWRQALCVIITVDLGKVEPIAGASYSTAAGVAGVEWPQTILVLVSEDGKSYRLAGDLVRLDADRSKIPPKGYGTHRYWTDKLRARGRYVTFMVSSPGPYIFADEVEVFRGDDSLLQGPPPGKLVGDPKSYFTNLVIDRAFRRRLEADLAAVRRAAPAGMKPQLDALQAEIDRAEFTMPKNFRSVFPINRLHRLIFAAQARVWRRRVKRPFLAWWKCRWDMLSPTEPPQTTPPRLHVAMMRGEHRSAAFILSNASDAAIEATIRFEGLPETPGLVVVHEALFTDTKTGKPVAAALPVARRDADAWTLTIPPGMHKQVWLALHSADAPAGDYRASVIVQPGPIRIPLRLRIYPLKFPARPALHLGGWDYTNNKRMYDVTPQNRAALIAHLRERFVDTPWATRSVMPYGSYDQTGRMTAPPSDAAFKAWLKLWPHARVYAVFAALRPTFAGFKQGTPEFERAVSAWIRWWAARLPELGVKPSQLALLLVDEPHRRAQDETILAYARVIQRAAPEVIVWEDPTWREPWKGLPQMFEACDVLCPNTPMWIAQGKRFAEFYVRQRRAGRKLWFYSCSGPAKLLDPYAYHRMQEWFCWKYRAEGSCFWAFGDSSGASSWNEYAAKRGAFTPVFLDATSVTAGKHMEAIREGVEDYEYLRMLRDRIAEAGPAADAKTLEEAKRLLVSAPDRVTACMTKSSLIGWTEPKDRTVADAAREEILEMLVRLK